jgi:penicillin-binding protein 1A
MIVWIVKIISRLSFLFIMLLAFCYFIYYVFSNEIQKVSFLTDYKPPISTYLYDKDLQKIREIAWEKRQYIAIDCIPQKLINAFIAAEDKHFFEHPGIDIFGIVRAVLENSIKRNWGKKPIGASTITQQVAKNIVVGNQHSIERKLNEALTAIAIEYSFSKKRILELYLNEIYLGKKSYGVAAAALTYFNKDLSSLSLSECAYLASLPKAPGNYDISKDKQKVLDRKNWVLLRMQQDGYIKQQEYEEAKKDELNSIILFSDQHDLDYFSEQVRRDLLASLGEHQLYGEGLSVITTQDTNYQKHAENVLKSHLLSLDKSIGFRGSLVTIDIDEEIKIDSENFKQSKTFHVFKTLPHPVGAQGWLLAIVLKAPVKKQDPYFIGLKDGRIVKLYASGMLWVKNKKKIENSEESFAGKNTDKILIPGDVILVDQHADKFYLEQIPEITGGLLVMDANTGAVLAIVGGYDPKMAHFNVVTQALRQPGSCFKPFVYLAALEEGLTGDSIIDDGPVEIYLGPGLGYYKPQNITKKSYGPTPLHVGLEQSRNQVTINLALKIGMKAINDVAVRLGIYDKYHKEWSLSLGSLETTMLKLTSAYASLANGGYKVTPHFISTVYNQLGEHLYTMPADLIAVSKTKEDFIPFDETVFDENNKSTIFDNRIQVIDTHHTNQLSEFLKGVVERGTGKKLKSIVSSKKINFCAKTGTTNDYKDAWCVGYTQNLSRNIVISVFIGYPIPQTISENAVGGRIALPIVESYLKKIKLK